MKSIVLGEGYIVFREGEVQQKMYRIQAGSVGIYVNYGDEDQHLMTELQEGAYFGEMALLEDRPRSATAVVTSETATLSEISYSELSNFFTECPDQISAIMRNLSGRIRSLTEEYREACGTVAEMDRKPTGQPGMLEELGKKIRRFVKVYFSSRKADMPDSPQVADSVWQPGAALGQTVCRKGEVLFREGDESLCMYHLVSGSVGIYKGYGTPGEKQLEIVEPNSFFGEMGLIDHAPRSATAVALEGHTAIRLIYEADLQAILTENPENTQIILRKLSARLRRLTLDYLETCRLIATLDEAERNHTSISAEDMALMRKAEEIWRLALMDASASYLLLGMGV